MIKLDTTMSPYNEEELFSFGFCETGKPTHYKEVQTKEEPEKDEDWVCQMCDVYGGFIQISGVPLCCEEGSVVSNSLMKEDDPVKLPKSVESCKCFIRKEGEDVQQS